MIAGAATPDPLPTRSRTGFVAAALAGLVATALLLVAPPATATTDPTQDYPRLPSTCVDEGERVPQHAVVCHLTPFRAKRPTVVLWGDSHAWMLVPALLEAATVDPVNPDVFTLGACPPLLVPAPPKGKNFGSKCERQNHNALKYVLDLKRAGRPVRVLLAANWVGYRQIYRDSEGGTVPTSYEPYAVQMSLLFHKGTPSLFRRLGELGVEVDVVGQIATVPRPPDWCPFGMAPYVCQMPRGRAIPEEAQTRDWVDLQMGKLSAKSHKPRYIDVNRKFCDPTYCYGTKDNIYTFFDDLHLSATRSRTLSGYFAKTLTFGS